MLNFSLPLAGYVSFVQVSVNLLRELYKRDQKICLFPLNDTVSLEAFKIDQEFGNWLQQSIQRAPAKYKAESPTLRLWHISQSWNQIGANQSLYTFLEVDQLQPNEENILQNQKNVFVSSKYTQKVLDDYGVKSIYCPLAFDDTEFFETGAQYLDDCISFGLSGKLESRKSTLRVLNQWVKRFGNDRRFRLNCLIHNPFLKNEDQTRLIEQALEGKQYFNVVFLGPQANNALVNDYMNACDIHISMSGGEGWNYQMFNAMALGKTAIGLSAHAHLDYMTENNSILVPTIGKRPSEDGVFFQKGAPYNQGNFWDYENSALLKAFDDAVDSIEIKNGKRVSKFYSEAIKVREIFTYGRTLDIILSHLK